MVGGRRPLVYRCLIALGVMVTACSTPAPQPTSAPASPTASVPTVAATPTLPPTVPALTAPTSEPAPTVPAPTVSTPTAAPTVAATVAGLRPGDSLRPPTLPPLSSPTLPPPTPPATLGASTPPARASPTAPGDWKAFAHPSGRWTIQYPADQLTQEDLGDGLTLFISQDRATFLAVDSLVVDGAFYGNTGEGLRNRARDSLTRIYGRAPQEMNLIDPSPPWEADLRFKTALGSSGQALYEERGRRLGDFHVLGVIVGYKTANAATAGPLTGAVFDALSVPVADPFRYCAHLVAGTASGPIGELGGVTRYTGPDQPFRNQRGAPLAWRCADGATLTCDQEAPGANCLALHVDRAPLPALVEHCRRAPDDANPPATATGANSVFVWACRGGAPVIVRQRIPFDQIDKYGYHLPSWGEVRRP